ncbi:hypothetical protein [Natrinema salaciae]|uniref:Small CPxCG-related zinc finger protein n=1 Tax=Natrinema salaciae TaxID=1186196 RepID=A0A1H9FGT9_9EURY|nr:hypothetical protein [Natrinema salaciae]SEQ37181.1 hypothetical protein SAMN04489841_1581 [Natrinema salaciae]
MRSDLEASEDDETPPRPACPNCGEPVAVVTAVGPHTGTASPCGCSVTPGLLKREH